MKYSANLGFLFRELSLPDAVRAAAKAGFQAVECHWPYETDPAELRAALTETGLPFLSLNTGVGDSAKGELGLSAVPGREVDARKLIDLAVDYAVAAGARNVHVLTGRASGPEARATFAANLRYAEARLGAHPVGLLIEPLNHRDAPGYFLRTVEEAVALVETMALSRLRVMFDCYHQQIEGGDLLMRFKAHAAHVGHVQFASVPARGEPDAGEVAYDRLLPAIVAAGYPGWLGAEYKPQASTLAGLGWLQRMTAEAV